jgi:hypothetical protein
VLVALSFFLNWALVFVVYMLLAGTQSALTKTLLYFAQVCYWAFAPATFFDSDVDWRV